MNIQARDLSKEISIVQLSQMAVTLITAIQSAVAAGRDSVDADELAASFAEKDMELVMLAESIARAKSEGR